MVVCEAGKAVADEHDESIAKVVSGMSVSRGGSRPEEFVVETSEERLVDLGGRHFDVSGEVRRTGTEKSQFDQSQALEEDTKGRGATNDSVDGMMLDDCRPLALRGSPADVLTPFQPGLADRYHFGSSLGRLR